jgi:serine-type D-Ala-D-Ala carboxypeptidase (penicillin-binding protein 5/6)
MDIQFMFFTQPMRFSLYASTGKLLAAACTLLLSSAIAAAPAIVPRPPEIAASSYILIDGKTGQVILESNADEPLPPASLTKMMTTYIASEELQQGNLQLSDMVHISEKAWSTQGSKMFVAVNSEVSVEDLLRGIIIQSGNDASVALAEHIGGSESAFADMMNQYAELLGMQNSFFMNSSGLDTADNYNIMSARDLAILARATVYDHAEYYSMYSEREFTYNNIRQPNRNTLLFRDRAVDGLKTGHTEAAGYCLVTSAARDGMRLIAIVMGAASENARAEETQKMLTYGFRYFETHQLYSGNQTLNSVPVWSGRQQAVDLGIEEEVFVTIPRGQSGAMSAAISVDEVIRAPLERGQVMGTITVSLEDDVLYQGNIIAMGSVEQGGLFKRFIDWLTLFFTGLFS